MDDLTHTHTQSGYYSTVYEYEAVNPELWFQTRCSAAVKVNSDEQNQSSSEQTQNLTENTHLSPILKNFSRWKTTLPPLEFRIKVRHFRWWCNVMMMMMTMKTTMMMT